MEVTVSIEAIAMIITIIVSFIVWLIRLEGKVAMNKTVAADHKDKMERMEVTIQKQENVLAGGTERFKHIDETLTEIKVSLQKLIEKSNGV